MRLRQHQQLGYTIPPELIASCIEFDGRAALSALKFPSTNLPKWATQRAFPQHHNMPLKLPMILFVSCPPVAEPKIKETKGF